MDSPVHWQWREADQHTALYDDDSPRDQSQDYTHDGQAEAAVLGGWSAIRKLWPGNATYRAFLAGGAVLRDAVADRM